MRIQWKSASAPSIMNPELTLGDWDPMPSRPVWQGHLRLSLVTCPVAVHKATTEARDVRFHLLNPDTHNRVKQAWKDAETGQEVERRGLLRGYEVAKDEHVIVDDEEL